MHSYYSLCPYAPDNSGRILVAGCDLEHKWGQVYILDSDGYVLDTFGSQRIGTSFYHTGLWQAWGPNGNSVYYSAGGGDVKHPRVAVRELDTGREYIMDGDMEGAPYFGEPIFHGLHGMLYAAGYGDGHYYPEESPVPFQNRDEHGIFSTSPHTGKKELQLSVNDILKIHPDRIRIENEDMRLKEKYGDKSGLTLMAYCVRYTRDGERLMFYFGNHCVDKNRGEPKITYIFTADKDLNNLQLALDLSFDKTGVHWSWHSDNERLIGYGPKPDGADKEICLATVQRDGSEYTAISNHHSGGHPSISPINYNLAVTDESVDGRGYVLFLDTRSGEIIQKVELPKYNLENGDIPKGRNPYWICHHPVFNRDGSKVLCNILPGRYSSLCELEVPIL